jgi:hypothetical protein
MESPFCVQLPPSIVPMPAGVHAKRSGWRRDFLCLCTGERGEQRCEHEKGYEQAVNSRNLSCQLTEVDTHLFSDDFPVEVVET